ncbi:hypothetical protein [Neobacillus sp. D3-1R]|uniref:hypothetical protein n=1 Tax=Neobacillus sp. D3-1R TaxID=3445778 RepID=UPI003FA0BE43
METLIKIKESMLEDTISSHLQMVFGIWINGHTYWLFNQTEKIITKEQLTVTIKQEFVQSNVRLSHIYITNHNESEKELKLLFIHRYAQASKDHFTFISPSEQVIFHLANKKVFLVNGHFEGKLMQQATIQPFWSMNTERMWNCSEKGILKYQPMAKGLAVSMFTLDLIIPSHTTKKASTWTIKGESKTELGKVNDILLKNTLAFPFKK